MQMHVKKANRIWFRGT